MNMKKSLAEAMDSFSISIFYQFITVECKLRYHTKGNEVKPMVIQKCSIHNINGK